MKEAILCLFDERWLGLEDLNNSQHLLIKRRSLSGDQSLPSYLTSPGSTDCLQILSSDRYDRIQSKIERLKRYTIISEERRRPSVSWQHFLYEETRSAPDGQLEADHLSDAIKVSADRMVSSFPIENEKLRDASCKEKNLKSQWRDIWLAFFFNNFMSQPSLHLISILILWTHERLCSNHEPAFITG